MPRQTLWIIVVTLLLIAQPNFADYLQTIPTFWQKVYPNGATSLYCGKKIAKGDRRYNIEHVFPMSWVTRTLACGTRKQCRANNAQFNVIEADMHNMYPAEKSLNSARGAMAYGMIKGENWVRQNCDLEINEHKRRVEPRPAARGNIARAMLYMADRYQLKLYRRDMLLHWHRQDPVDAQEKRRNRIIAALQGNTNPWISGTAK